MTRADDQTEYTQLNRLRNRAATASHMEDQMDAIHDIVLALLDERIRDLADRIENEED